jgi:hypothetical protein
LALIRRLRRQDAGHSPKLGNGLVAGYGIATMKVAQIKLPVRANPMSTSNKLIDGRLKVEWAKAKIVDLNNSLKAFFSTKPYKVGRKRDPQTRKPIYYVESVALTPIELSSLAGNIVHDLRSALDYLAFELFNSSTTKPVGANESKIQFPIGDSLADYQSKCSRQVKGIDPSAVKAFDALDPYQGGNGHQFWVLHRLDNIDKHRRLVIVGSYFRSINLGAFLCRMMKDSLPAHFGEMPILDAFFKPADTLCPLKAGDELFIDAPDAKMDDELEFQFDVSLYEPPIIEGKPLVETINHLAQLVGDTLTNFIPLL